MNSPRYVIPFEQICMADLDQVGSANASLGEMINQLPSSIPIPGGFATTADAFRELLRHEQLDKFIQAMQVRANFDDASTLAPLGKAMRDWIMGRPLPTNLDAAIRQSFAKLDAVGRGFFTVRSWVISDEPADESFTGLQATFFNLSGIDNVLHAIKQAFAGFYNDSAIASRAHSTAQGKIALSAAVQRMVRSNSAASGVISTLDTESGCDQVVLITSSYGLRDAIAQGVVTPDEFYVHKPMLSMGKTAIIRKNLGSKRIKKSFSDQSTCGAPTQIIGVATAERHRFSLSNEDILKLARYAVSLERHYGCPMEIEWGKSDDDGKLYIEQARPLAVSTRASGKILEKYVLRDYGHLLLIGRAVGQQISTGVVRIVKNAAEMGRVQPGDVLVTDMTDSNWEPAMNKASAVVTKRGGRTCHAASLARKLGIPALVGCGQATEMLVDGEAVTISCAEGAMGSVYRGHLYFEISRIDLTELAPLPVTMMLNVSNPEQAFELAKLPNDGVGLARLEFIINKVIGIHPKAVLETECLEPGLQEAIHCRARGYGGPRAYFVEKLAEGVATIAAAFWPKPVLVRFSDFKTNSYRELLGGEHFDPEETNPMIALRDPSRFVSSSFRECFAMETMAIRKVREHMGFTNVQLMIPFVHTLEEARGITNILMEHGLQRGYHDLKLIMVYETPSSAPLDRKFLQYFDGISIGVKDLNLGLDLESMAVAQAFDEPAMASKLLVPQSLATACGLGKYIGFCRQNPSYYPDFVRWMTARGIQSISLDPEIVLSTWPQVIHSPEGNDNPCPLR